MCFYTAAQNVLSSDPSLKSNSIPNPDAVVLFTTWRFVCSLYVDHIKMCIHVVAWDLCLYQCTLFKSRQTFECDVQCNYVHADHSLQLLVHAPEIDDVCNGCVPFQWKCRLWKISSCLLAHSTRTFVLCLDLQHFPMQLQWCCAYYWTSLQSIPVPNTGALLKTATLRSEILLSLPPPWAMITMPTNHIEGPYYCECFCWPIVYYACDQPCNCMCVYNLCLQMQHDYLYDVILLV